jgi:glycerol-3-phosphate dehydrogenase
MAITVEDVLARRTRCLFLDSGESIRIAPQVAKKMAEIMKKDKTWIDKELKKFNTLCENYKA